MRLGASIAKKQVMAITGFILVIFLVVHLGGNLLLFCGPEVFNRYAHTLENLPLFPFIEGVLALVFLGHVALGVILTIQNRRAKGGGAPLLGAQQLASRSMIITGCFLLVFIIKHILDFKFGPIYQTTVDGAPVRDVYRLVVEHFQSGAQVGFYLLAMAVMGVHVAHGFWSLFQSLGFYCSTLRKWSPLFGLLLALGFSSIPVTIYWGGIS